MSALNALIAQAGDRVATDGANIVKAYAYGQQQQKQSALAGLASRAAAGDTQALQQVAGLSPETYQQIAGGLAKMNEQQRTAYKDTIDQFGKIALWADTPEKWDYAVDMLSKQYPGVAQYKGQFGAREPFIAQARTIKETLDSGTVFSGGRVQNIPGAVEAGADKIGAETAAKEANSYQSFAPGSMVVPPQGSALAGLGRPATPAAPGAPAAPGGAVAPAPQVPEVFQGIVSQHAERTGLSPRLVGAVVMQESGGRPNAVSDKGAQGLMQVMPDTARNPGFGVQPARDGSIDENVRVGTDYLAAMKQRYGGDEKLALAAYNWGPGAVDDWLASGGDPRKVPAETQRYVYRLTGSLLGGPQGQPAQPPGRVQVADASGGIPAGAFVVPKPQEPTSDQREYQQAVTEGFKGSFMDYQRELKKAGAASVTVNGDNSLQKELGSVVGKRVESSMTTANAAVGQLTATAEAKRLLDSGIITGAGANWKLALDKALAGLGFNGEKVANTEAFMAAMGRQTMDLVKNLGAGAGISNADRDFAAQVAGGNIDLTEQSIRKIIDINERAARATIARHNAFVKPIIDDPNTPGTLKATLVVDAPPEMAAAAPQSPPQMGGQSGQGSGQNAQSGDIYDRYGLRRPGK